MLVPVVLLAMMLSPVFKFWLYLFRIIVLSRLVAVLYLLCVCVCVRVRVLGAAVLLLSHRKPNVRLLVSESACYQAVCVCCLSVCGLVLSVYLKRGSQ